MTWKTPPRLAEIYIQNYNLTSALITLPANLPMIEETPINDEKPLFTMWRHLIQSMRLFHCQLLYLDEFLLRLPFEFLNQHIV